MGKTIIGSDIIKCEKHKCSFLSTCMRLNKNKHFDVCVEYTNKPLTCSEHKNHFFDTWDGTSGNL